MSDSSAFSGLEQVVTQTAHDFQSLINKLRVADGGLSISFNNGHASPLAVDIQRWATTNSFHQRAQQDMLAALAGPLVVARQMLNVDDLRDCLADDLVALSRLCRISVGHFEFGLDYSQACLTARNGAIRDFNLCRRLMFEEIPYLAAIAQVRRALARAYRPARR